MIKISKTYKELYEIELKKNKSVIISTGLLCNKCNNEILFLSSSNIIKFFCSNCKFEETDIIKLLKKFYNLKEKSDYYDS